MVFASFVFLFGFLPALLALHQVTPRRFRNLTLLAFSYAFYSWWRIDFCLLLGASTLVDFIAGRRIEAAGQNTRLRNVWLFVSVIFNLGLLGYFKYANFGVESLNSGLALAGLEPVGWTTVVLPIGISFITFQTMSYTIDVYRRQVKASANLLEFATYVSLFPQLVAGPIVRYKTVAAELTNRVLSLDRFAFGVMMFIIGFSKKVIFANNFGLVADEAFGSAGPGWLGAWIGVSAYTLQIYFDFSGYSDMAVGLGAMLGFQFPENFDRPYTAKSITEFWRRWHMTLSSWIRDYLYISLGGNRGGHAKTYRNLILSMLLCGLWHGANWTFIVWGAFHGAWLIKERVMKGRGLLERLPRAPQVFATLLIVALGWVLFRADTIGDATAYLRSLLDFGAPPLARDSYWTRHPALLLLMAIAWGVVFFGKPAVDWARKRTVAATTTQMALFFVAIFELISQGFSPFLYFQF